MTSGDLTKIPAVECVQPEGNDTISGPLRDGATKARSVACTTQVSGLQVAMVVDGDLTIDECRSTGGTGHLVKDEDVWAIQKRLAREEGLFSEPAGVVALTGALKAVREGLIRPEASTVCLITGSGFKDDAAVDRINADSDCPLIDPEMLDHW
jgi:threonine synthase